MALDVWVGAPSKNWFSIGSKLVTSFEPEAYYWFLYPLFEEFQKSSGILIDLYDGARFESYNLQGIKKLFNEGEGLVSEQSDRFEVHVGSQVEPEEKELFETVDKKEFLYFLSELRSAIELSESSGKPLIFFGD